MAARPDRRRAIRLLLSLVVVLGLAAGAWWWTHPQAFESGAGARAVLHPVPLADTPFYVGFVESTHGKHAETITFHSVRVRLRDNTAGATVTVAVCTRRPVSEGTLALGIGTAADEPSLRTLCTRLRPVRPGLRMRLDGGREYLIATISPARSGRAVFASADLTYSRDGRHLYQRGTQHVEVGTVTTVQVSD